MTHPLQLTTLRECECAHKCVCGLEKSTATVEHTHTHTHTHVHTCTYTDAHTLNSFAPSLAVHSAWHHSRLSEKDIERIEREWDADEEEDPDDPMVRKRKAMER